MDHRSLIASLSREQRQHLTRKADAPGLTRLAVHGGTIVGVGWLIAERVPLWPALMVADGILLVFLFTLLHEAIHRTAFRTLWLNEAVGRVCGFLLLLPADWFRYFHFAHHRHTQDPEKDPELAAPPPDSLGRYALHLSGLPVWRSQIGALVRNALGRCSDDFVPLAGRAKVRREARVMLIGYGLVAGASAALGSAAPLHLWIMPLLLGQPFLRLYLMAEHGRCPMVANMLENTRTTFTNALVRGLAWNMPFHAEHHAYPAVPFHRLPELHRLASAHLRQTERGYARFHRNYVAGIGS